jgi:hypothetical protein
MMMIVRYNNINNKRENVRMMKMADDGGGGV